jgi:hypothetical protein
VTPPDVKRLREVVREAEQVARLPLPWEWWTSNSLNRLSSASGRDGDVLYAYTASDGVADVAVGVEAAALIAAAVNELPALLDRLEKLRDKLAEVQWCDVKEYGCVACCPDCKQSPARGHAADCDLSALLDLARLDAEGGTHGE